MRIVFMGTPEFAVPTLTEMVAAGHEVVAVYTRAPKPAGRGMTERRSPVHELAARFAIPVLTPGSLRNEAAVETFRAHGADVAVVVAYGLILPKAVLDAPRYGCLNLHASLLPRWRGAAPIARAVMAGDEETGVTVMRMDEGLDTGPIGLAERVPIGPDATAGDIHDQLAPLGADLMLRALAALSREALEFHPQAVEEVSYAHKIDKAECRIDWRREARSVHNQIRGLSPFPAAFFEADLGKGLERVKALRSRLVEAGGAPGVMLDEAMTIACGTAAIRLIEVQRAGKAPMHAQEFLRGARLARGTTLG